MAIKFNIIRIQTMKNIIKLLSAVLLVANLTPAKAADDDAMRDEAARYDAMRDEAARVVTDSFAARVLQNVHVHPRGSSTKMLRRMQATAVQDALSSATDDDAMRDEAACGVTDSFAARVLQNVHVRPRGSSTEMLRRMQATAVQDTLSAF